MKRWQAMIVEVDVDKLTATQKTKLLKQIVDSEIEIDCLTPDIYIDDEVMKDDMLALMKAKKATCKANFPKRYVEDSASEADGILDKDNKKYVRLTEDNLATSTGYVKEVKDTVVTQKFLESMLLTPLKDWVKARGIDKAIDLRLKKADIISAILTLLYGENYGIEKN